MWTLLKEVKQNLSKLIVLFHEHVFKFIYAKQNVIVSELVRNLSHLLDRQAIFIIFHLFPILFCFLSNKCESSSGRNGLSEFGDELLYIGNLVALDVHNSVFYALQSQVLQVVQEVLHKDTFAHPRGAFDA